MITGTEAWLHRLEIDSDRIVSALYVTNVPKSIVIDVMQGKSEPRDVAGVARTDARGA